MFSRGFRALGYRYALAAIPAIGLSNDRFKFNGTINCMQAPAIAAAISITELIAAAAINCCCD